MKFIRVFDKNRNVVFLNAENIVALKEYDEHGWGKVKILDVCGNIYTSMEDLIHFGNKLGVTL